MAASLKTSVDELFPAGQSLNHFSGFPRLTPRFLAPSRTRVVLFKIRYPALFILPDQLPNVFTRSSPITRCHLAFHIDLEIFRKRDVQRSHFL